MKIIFVALIMTFCAASYGQVDTSLLPITITLKVKHIEYMAYNLSNSNTLSDVNYRDSLIKYLGAGTDSNANVITHFPAGRIYALVQNLLNEQANVSYSSIYELGNGSSGFTGIVAQLIGKWANGSDPEQKTALWLYSKIAY